MREFVLTQQGKQAFVKALNCAKHGVISTENMVLGLSQVFDTSAGYELTRYGITSRKIKHEIDEAVRVKEHRKNIFNPQLSTNSHDNDIAEHDYLSNLSTMAKISPVEFIVEPGKVEVKIQDRIYKVTAYLYKALKYAKEYAIESGEEEIQTSFILAGMAENEDSNAFFLLFKLKELADSGFNHAYVNNVYEAFSNWYRGYKRDGSQTERREEQWETENHLSNKLMNPNYSLLDEYGTDLTELARKGLISPVIGREKVIDELAVILNRRQKSNALLVGPAGVGKTAIAEGLAIKIANNELPSLKGRKLIELKTSELALLTSTAHNESIAHHLVNELMRDRDKILVIDEIQLLRTMAGSNFLNVLKPGLARGDFQIIGATTPLEVELFFYKDEALKRRFEIIPVNQPKRTEADKIIANTATSYENFYHANYSKDTLHLAVDLAKAYMPTALPDAAFTLLDNAGALYASEKGQQPQAIIEYVNGLRKLRKKLRVAEIKSLNDEEVKALKKKLGAYHHKITKEKNDFTKHAYDEVIDSGYVRKATELIIQHPISKSKISQLQKERAVENEDVLTVADRLKEKVIGQDKAVDELATGLIVAKAGLRKPGAPIGSYFFAGTTGVGKTETAKQLANEFYGSESHLARFNMAEYSGPFDNNSFMRDLYIQIVKDPEICLLFDEIEKANPGIFKVFLGIMDDGSFLNDTTIPIDFSKTTIIFTSNLGATKSRKMGFSNLSEQDDHDRILQTVNSFFAPEFINRLTKIIVFNQLKESDLLEITGLLLRKKASLLMDQGIGLKWDRSVLSYIVDKYADEQYGARPLERGIDQEFATQLARLILDKEISKGQTVLLTVTNNDLNVKVED